MVHFTFFRCKDLLHFVQGETKLLFRSPIHFPPCSTRVSALFHHAMTRNGNNSYYRLGIQIQSKSGNKIKQSNLDSITSDGTIEEVLGTRIEPSTNDMLRNLVRHTDS